MKQRPVVGKSPGHGPAENRLSRPAAAPLAARIRRRALGGWHRGAAGPGGDEDQRAHRHCRQWPGRHRGGQPADEAAGRGQRDDHRCPPEALLPARLHARGHRCVAGGQGGRPDSRLHSCRREVDSGDGGRVRPGGECGGDQRRAEHRLRLPGGGHGPAAGLRADRGHGRGGDRPQRPGQRLRRPGRRRGQLDRTRCFQANGRPGADDAAGRPTEVRPARR